MIQALPENPVFLRRLLRQINRNLPNSVLGGMIAASFLCYFYIGEFSDAVVFGWTGIIFALFLSRGLVGYLYQRKNMFTVHQYLKFLSVNIILSGIGWGAVSILFIDPSKSFLMSISVLALAGVTAGALTSMNGLSRLSALFITLSLSPLIFTLWRSAIDESAAMVIVISLYYLIIVSSALKMATNTHINIERSIKFEAREKQIRNIINSSINAVITVNSNIEIIDWNNTAEEVLGWPREQAMGRDLIALLSADSSPGTDVLGEIKSGIGEGNFQQRSYITDIANCNGDCLTVKLNVSAIITGESSVFTIHIYDMTEQIEQEEALILANKKSKDLLNSMHAGIVELDQYGQIGFMNRSAFDTLQYDNSILGQSFYEHIVPDDLFDVAAESPIINCLLKGDIREVDLDSFMRSDGVSIYVQYTCSPHYIDNEISGLVISFNDITEQYRAKLEQSRLLQITESSPELIATFTMDGSILSLNQSLRNLLENRGDIDGSLNLRSIFPEQEYEQLFNTAIPTAYMGKIWKGESKLKTGQDKTILVSQIIMQHQASFDGTQYYSTILSDITESKKSEAMLLAAKDAAEAAALAKSEFLATMSHEIRTPMNGVLGMAQLLLDTKLDDEQQEFTRAIELSGSALLTIINDILDFSKIEAGQMTLEPIEFDLERSAHEVCSLMMPKVSEKGLELILDFDTNCPRRVVGDAGRLRQIFMNLIGNALKFTEKGHITVKIGANVKSEQCANITFSIADTGIGIAAKNHAKLFDSFTQADASTTRKYGGTGLGLSICQQLIDLMGGKIQMESEVGKGSRFFFTIDMPVAGKQPQLKRSSLYNRRVIIVDDNKINLQVLSRQLEHVGMIVGIASHYRQAIELMQQAARREEPFELAILDYLMPELDGEQLGLKIMQDESIPDCPLVLYSSAARKGEAKSFEEIGFRGYLAKPTYSDILRKTLECVLGEYESGTGTSSMITRHSVEEEHNALDQYDFNGFKILLAEDNPINQKVAVSLVEKQGFEVVVAGNGQEAIDIFKQGTFHAVLMDCQMPVKDGFEATAEIIEYESQNKTKTPIIALTANAMESDREKCLAAGMVDFVPKPFSREVLLEVIKRWVNGDTNMTAPPDEIIKVQQPSATNAIDQITINQLKEDMGEDFGELIPVFIESTREIIDSLETSFVDNDTEVFMRHAHSLKSSSANLGGFNLSNLAASLEHHAKSGNLPDSVDFMIELRSEILRMENELAEIAA